MVEKIQACSLVLGWAMMVGVPWAVGNIRVNRKPKRIHPAEPVFIQPKVRRV